MLTRASSSRPYSPLTKGRRLDDPAVAAVAAQVERTHAQGIIRWSLQKGSSRCVVGAGRIDENSAVFDFALDDASMAVLDALDEGLTTGWDPATQA